MAVRALAEDSGAPPGSRVWRRPDVVVAVPVGALAIALADYLLLLQVTNVRTMIEKTSRHPAYLGTLAVLVPLTFLLFGANFAVAGLLWRLRAGRANQAGSLLGAVVGGFGAACPSCGAFLLAVVGVTAGLSVLPFAGLEIWVAAGAIMAFTLYRSVRALDQATCTTEAGSIDCRELPSVSRAQVTATAILGLILLAGLVGMAFINEPHLR